MMDGGIIGDGDDPGKGEGAPMGSPGEVADTAACIAAAAAACCWACWAWVDLLAHFSM